LLADLLSRDITPDDYDLLLQLDERIPPIENSRVIPHFGSEVPKMTHTSPKKKIKKTESERKKPRKESSELVIQSSPVRATTDSSIRPNSLPPIHVGRPRIAPSASFGNLFTQAPLNSEIPHVNLNPPASFTIVGKGVQSTNK
jgi:hypothetical protein